LTEGDLAHGHFSRNKEQVRSSSTRN
jgi:hypothetical protein